jgi:glycosyltransferase involved in cell wall biosynthesis
MGAGFNSVKMRILVLLFYYNRPKMVLNALHSIRDTTHGDFEVAFIDDGSELPGRPVVEEFFKDRPDILGKFKFFNTGDSRADKEARGGSVFGRIANEAIMESDADLGIMLCDDDALLPEYLSGLSDYFSVNPEVKYAYSHMILFNPVEEPFDSVKTRREASAYLNWTHPLHPFCQVDSSQVCWRLSCNKEGGVWLPHPQTSNHDATFYSGLFGTYGNCVFTGLVGQFKGWCGVQLGKRADTYGGCE